MKQNSYELRAQIVRRKFQQTTQELTRSDLAVNLDAMTEDLFWDVSTMFDIDDMGSAYKFDGDVLLEELVQKIHKYTHLDRALTKKMIELMYSDEVMSSYKISDSYKDDIVQTLAEMSRVLELSEQGIIVAPYDHYVIKGVPDRRLLSPKAYLCKRVLTLMVSFAALCLCVTFVLGRHMAYPWLIPIAIWCVIVVLIALETPTSYRNVVKYARYFSDKKIRK